MKRSEAIVLIQKSLESNGEGYYSNTTSDVLQALEDAGIVIETPDTFDPAIPAERYHIWCKHHQKVSELDAEKLHRAEKDLKLALDALQREADENEELKKTVNTLKYKACRVEILEEKLKELNADTPTPASRSRADAATENNK